MKWKDILVSAKEYVDFLEQDIFFNKPFVNTVDALVITDAELGFKYANDSEDENFPEWEGVSKCDTFPDDFEFYRTVYHNLEKLKNFGIYEKNFSGVHERWKYNAQELFHEDMTYIFHCYANDYFPPIWEKILQAYLSGGLPCGWSDFYPKGKLVVFSNE